MKTAWGKNKSRIFTLIPVLSLPFNFFLLSYYSPLFIFGGQLITGGHFPRAEQSLCWPMENGHSNPYRKLSSVHSLLLLQRSYRFHWNCMKCISKWEYLFDCICPPVSCITLCTIAWTSATICCVCVCVRGECVKVCMCVRLFKRN